MPSMPIPPVIAAFLPNELGYVVLATGIEEATRRSAPLVVVHAIGDRAAAEEAAFEEEELEAVNQALTNSGIDHDVRFADAGRSAATEVVEVATKENAQLVVIGVRSRSTVGRALFGSNSLGILDASPCPVLCVRTEHAVH